MVHLAVEDAVHLAAGEVSNAVVPEEAEEAQEGALGAGEERREERLVEVGDLEAEEVAEAGFEVHSLYYIVSSSHHIFLLPEFDCCSLSNRWTWN